MNRIATWQQGAVGVQGLAAPAAVAIEGVGYFKLDL